MRPGVPYEGNELVLFREAMRLVPAITKARVEKRPQDAFVLFQGYVSDAKGFDVPMDSAWSIFALAAVHWTQQLYEGLAKESGQELTVLLDRAIATAADWVTSAD